MVLNDTGRWSAQRCVPTLERGNDKNAQMTVCNAFERSLIQFKLLTPAAAGA